MAEQTTHKTLNEFLQEYVGEYRAADEPWPADTKTIASWVIRTGRWKPPRKSLIDILAPMISRALREEYFTDHIGRRVRKKHAVRENELLPDGSYKQHTFWVDIHDAPPEMMLQAFQQRRGQVLGECKQLKTDVDYYNDSVEGHDEIQMSFNFEDDLLEASQPTEYDDIKPM